MKTHHWVSQVQLVAAVVVGHSPAAGEADVSECQHHSYGGLDRGFDSESQGRFQSPVAQMQQLAQSLPQSRDHLGKSYQAQCAGACPLSLAHY